ncbi:MAG: bifunctional glutamate N-acetyltransferase/amino-acid acetyltransferase ArgJ [Acidimicrobiia bacterium]|nr:bifunctional glutamate N-acetyltransferase/amino-acid acetyltransferase ArgJ [Acidimicrobiia bacterium]
MGVCAAQGWSAAGVPAGIKGGGAKDVAVIASGPPARAAAVFTRNLVRAAPVIVSMRRLARHGAFRAVVVSSGNANAATGEAGIDVAESMCGGVASTLGCEAEEVLIAQTGLIGVELDAQIAVRGAEAAARRVSADGGMDAARAILTTDTVEKIAVEKCRVDGGEVAVGGIAKGAAMLAPSMATMLAVVTTDAAAAPAVLRRALGAAMEESFHSVFVDGCTSTNDTVLLLANGAAGTREIETREDPAYAPFAGAVAAVCRSLARQMAADAEGATKLVTVDVTGAASDADARCVARAVAGSLLVKCSLAGEDPYWGRVLADAGASGAVFDPSACEISYGGVVVCRGGVAVAHDTAAVTAHMRGRDIVIGIDLGSGAGRAEVWGSDLTHDYVDENMGTS